MSGILDAALGVAFALLWTVSAALAAGGTVVENPWAWSSTTPQQRTGAAYLTIVNRGAEADRLLGASSPIAKSVMLHETIKNGDILRMRPVKELAIPPGEAVVLEPGGRHLMLMGLVTPLEHGVAVPLTLIFQHAGRVTVELAVHDRRHHPDGMPAADHEHMRGQAMEPGHHGEMNEMEPMRPGGMPHEPSSSGMPHGHGD